MHPIIIFSLILSFFVQESRAVRTGDQEEGSSSTMARTPSTALSTAAGDVPVEPTLSPPLKKRVEAFSAKLQAAAIQDPYVVCDLFEEFRQTLGRETEWEEIATAQGIQRWPWQVKSWQNAVGAQLFFNAAFNTPHQHLLRNALKPLLHWASEEEERLEEGYTSARSAVFKLMQRHSFMRRRAALFALAAAARLQHPIALLCLTEGLNYCNGGGGKGSFFTSNHTLIKCQVSQEGGREALCRFIKVPDIKEYVDLEGEALEDIKQLNAKADLGLVLYNVLAGIILERDAQLPYVPHELDRAIAECKIAADSGDPDGALNTSKLMYAAVCDNVKSQQPLELRDAYRNKAALYGNEAAYKNVSTQARLKSVGIPGTLRGIFKEVKRFFIKKIK